MPPAFLNALELSKIHQTKQAYHVLQRLSSVLFLKRKIIQFTIVSWITDRRVEYRYYWVNRAYWLVILGTKGGRNDALDDYFDLVDNVGARFWFCGGVGWWFDPHSPSGGFDRTYCTARNGPSTCGLMKAVSV